MRIKRSYLSALAMVLVIAAWFATGIFRGDGAQSTTPDTARAAKPLPRVQVQTFLARQRRPELRIRGRTEVFRRIEVRAQTSGAVERVLFGEGDFVDKGSVLCRIEMGTRQAQLAEARAQLAQARLDFSAARNLERQQFASKTKLAAERAKMQAAEAAVARIQREIEYTRITAPVSGTIEMRPAETGSFLQIGALCASVVVRDPMLVVGQVSERHVAALKNGQAGSADLVTGERVSGRIRFISPVADPNTRTFRVELEVANPDRRLRDGVTSEIVIPLPPIQAQRLPSSVLTLNDDGRIGVVVLDDKAVAGFVAVDVLSDTREGVWVSGLPAKVRIVTRGQNFVSDGQKVEAVQISARSSDK